MFIKLTYLLIMLSPALAEDKLVRELSGEHEGNRVTVCIGNGTECEGALWDTQWVIVRASCLADKPMYQVTVVRTAHREHCAEYVKELAEKNERVRRVELVLKHPTYAHAHSSRAEYDLALLRLHYSYHTVERLTDPAEANTLLQQTGGMTFLTECADKAIDELGCPPYRVRCPVPTSANTLN